ncbi:unnamed protein product [Malus baccata var. baccata]
MSPFQALYGVPPPSIHTYLPGTTVVHSVDAALQDRDQLLHLLRTNFQLVQNRMKQIHDKGQTEREFRVGDWVFLKLQPYQQQCVVMRHSNKLAPKMHWHCGLSSPPSTQLKNPSYFSRVPAQKEGWCSGYSKSHPSTDRFHGVLPLATRNDIGLFKKKNKAVTKWLIKWVGLPTEDATWEEADDIIAQFLCVSLTLIFTLAHILTI